MSDTGWKQVLGSQEGDHERIFTVPSPDEDGGTLQLRLVVYKEAANKRWRAHAYFDKHELFRIHKPSLNEAQVWLEDSTKNTFRMFLGQVT